MSDELASIVLAAPGVVGTFFRGTNGHVAYRYVSPQSREVFGLPPADIIADARVFFRRLGRDHLEKLNESLLRSARELSLLIAEFPFEHPQKDVVWIEAQATPVQGADGSILWHGYASDITSRKRVELELAQIAQRLQATIDASQDAVVTVNASGMVQSVNSAGAVLFGYGAEEIVGKGIDALLEIPFDGIKFDPGNFTDCARRERMETLGKRKNGEFFPGELTLSEARIDSRRVFVAFVKDLTRQRMIEQKMEELHRNRVEAMGGMAAALAHELNQPLAANATYLRVARRLVENARLGDQGAEIIDVLAKAAAQTLRAGRIVASLRDLMRGDEPDKTNASVHEIIREAYQQFVSDNPGREIAINLDLHALRDQVVADRSQLKHVVANLIRNAVEAMQDAERRELVIRTGNLDERTICIDVTDTGCGLPDFSDIGWFEPFTTTKAKGMGVGLSISRSIVEAHYGKIWAKPNAGGGSIFSFTLPLRDPDVNT